MKNKLLIICLIPLVFAVSTGFIVSLLTQRQADIAADTSETYSPPTSETEKTSSTEDDSEPDEEYKGITDPDTLISCIVTVDPEPFEFPSKADKTQLMQIAFWCVLQSGKDENYDFSQKCMLIPQSEVEKMYRSLFGNTKMPQPENLDFQGVTFTYDKKDKTYNVPITGITSRYTAKTVEEKKNGNKLVFLTEYIPKSNWTQTRDGEIVAPEAQKTMSITLKKGNNNLLSVYSVKKE